MSRHQIFAPGGGKRNKNILSYTKIIARIIEAIQLLVL